MHMQAYKHTYMHTVHTYGICTHTHTNCFNSLHSSGKAFHYLLDCGCGDFFYINLVHKAIFMMETGLHCTMLQYTKYILDYCVLSALEQKFVKGPHGQVKCLQKLFYKQLRAGFSWYTICFIILHKLYPPSVIQNTYTQNFYLWSSM